MNNLIRIYDNVLSDEKCSYFVNKFEEHSNMHEIQDNGNGRTLTYINLLSSADTPFRNDLDYLSNFFMKNVERYKEDCNIQPFQFPDKFGIAPFRL